MERKLKMHFELRRLEALSVSHERDGLGRVAGSLSSGLPSYHHLLQLDGKHKSNRTNHDGSLQQVNRTTDKSETREGNSIAFKVATSRAEEEEEPQPESRYRSQTGRPALARRHSHQKAALHTTPYPCALLRLGSKLLVHAGQDRGQVRHLLLVVGELLVSKVSPYDHVLDASRVA